MIPMGLELVDLNLISLIRCEKMILLCYFMVTPIKVDDGIWTETCLLKTYYDTNIAEYMNRQTPTEPSFNILQAA